MIWSKSFCLSDLDTNGFVLNLCSLPFFSSKKKKNSLGVFSLLVLLVKSVSLCFIVDTLTLRQSWISTLRQGFTFIIIHLKSKNILVDTVHRLVFKLFCFLFCYFGDFLSCYHCWFSFLLKHEFLPPTKYEIEQSNDTKATQKLFALVGEKNLLNNRKS